MKYLFRTIETILKSCSLFRATCYSLFGVPNVARYFDSLLYFYYLETTGGWIIDAYKKIKLLCRYNLNLNNHKYLTTYQ